MDLETFEQRREWAETNLKKYKAKLIKRIEELDLVRESIENIERNIIMYQRIVDEEYKEENR